MWLGQDGAHPLFSRQVRNWLNNHFPDKWIGRGSLDRLAFTFPYEDAPHKTFTLRKYKCSMSWINRILLAVAGIRANLDTWIMSETPLEVAGKWACHKEKAT
jgi:hypothetical protein